MCEILLNPTVEGFRFMADDFEIIIDPTDDCEGNCDAFMVSNIRSFHGNLRKNNAPVFVSESIKKLSLYTSNTEDITVVCASGEKHTLRKNGKRVLDFRFIEFNSRPDSSMIVLEEQNNIIVYTSGAIEDPSLIPPCNTLILNGGARTPLKSILKTVPSFSVQISDFSRFFEVISNFNSYVPENTVGIDHTVLEAACHFLKNNCTVFSKAVKPLSAFKELPPVIITTTPDQYPHRPAIPDSVFMPQLSLRDIYSVSSTVSAEKTIVVLSDYYGKRQRGNLTICGTGNIFQV